MKKLILILLLAQGFCFAQTENATPPKPAADDCPDFKKKKGNGKAEYFQFLRSGKSAKGQAGQVVNGVYYPNGAPQAVNTRTQTREQNPYLEQKKERRVNEKPPIKNNTVEAEIVKEEKIVEAPTEEVVSEKEEPTPIPSVATTEEQKVEEPIKNETATIEKVEKDKLKKDKKIKRKLNTNTLSGKTKNCKPGKASKCPQF